MSTKFRAVFAGLGLLLLSGLSWADGPCPDGQFNPQSSVCMCPEGGFVAPNTYCNATGKTYLRPHWGAIALDVPQQRGSAFSRSTDNQADANRRALRTCGYNQCKVYLMFKNTCGAVASDSSGNNILGSGLSNNEKEAENNAIAQCTRNGGKNCVIWVRAQCAGAPIRK